MNLTKRYLLPCTVAIGIMAIVSCDTVTLTEEPTMVDATATLGGYPDIQALMNSTLDDALAAVDASTARSAAPDPAYETFRRVLSRARDIDVATARALKLDRASLAEVTDAERKAIEKLADNDPGLKADLAALVEKLHAQFAAIPPVEVKVQPLDKDKNPAGTPYTIRSEHGFIDFGASVLTVPEFLLIVQEGQYEAARGFVIDDEWDGDGWPDGRPWPSATVNYYFASSLSRSDRTWMSQAMQRMEDGTGMEFYESTSADWWLEFWHGLCLSKFLRISKEQLGYDGTATVGKLGCSKLVMDTDHVQHEDDFNHEMGHVFGLLHEHQRYDRSTYVYVPGTGSHFDPIPERRKYWFLFRSWYTDNSTTYSTPYDYQSIMHYSGFGITLRSTGEPWDVYDHNNSEWGDENGNTWFTPWDIYTIKKRYGITPNPMPTYTPDAP